MPFPTLNPPTGDEPPDTFDALCLALGLALQQFGLAGNALEANVVAKEANVVALEAAAQGAVASALAAANYKGEWSAQAGALNKPASVSQGGIFWALKNNLANVALSQPGVTGDWEQIDKVQGNAVAGVNLLRGADVASSATPNIWTAALGNVIAITGTTATTGFTNAPIAGAERWLVAAAAWPLTHGANLLLPGQANYTCAAGDIVHVFAVTTTQFRLTIYKADGTPIVNKDGRILLATLTASNSAALVATGIFPSTYEEIECDLINLVPSVDAGVFRLRTSSDGGATWAQASGDYNNRLMYQTPSTPTPTGYASTTDTWVNLIIGTISNTAAQGGVSGRVRLVNPAGTAAKKEFSGHTTGPNDASTAFFQLVLACIRNSTSAINGLQFTYHNGNIASGVVRIYGIKK